MSFSSIHVILLNLQDFTSAFGPKSWKLFLINECVEFNSLVFWKRSPNRRSRVPVYMRACKFWLWASLPTLFTAFVDLTNISKESKFHNTSICEILLDGDAANSEPLQHTHRAIPSSWPLCLSFLNSCIEIGFHLVFDSVSPRAITCG